MNRRDMLKLTAAVVAMPSTLRATQNDANEWDSLAVEMAEWQRSANRHEFGVRWRAIRERTWITYSGDTTLIYLSSPERTASRELLAALVTLGAATSIPLEPLAVELLGIGATNCNHVAAAFVLAGCERVQRSLGGWRIVRPQEPQ